MCRMNIKWFGTFENSFIFGSIGLGKISITVVGKKSTDGMIAFAWLLTSKQWLIGSQLRNRIMHVVDSQADSAPQLLLLYRIHY